ncbi:MAG: primosomal protein N' [Bacteroidales bacterium]|nr:primosomal protein N' [Bacteroidales bacterium]
MKTLFVDVLLPLHLKDTYTYRVPQEYNEDIRVGQRVVVQFGAKRLYAGVVRRIHENVPQYQVKYILSVLDENPLVTERQFQLWEWIAQYYMSYLGDVMTAAVPSAFKLASESAVTIHPEYDGELSNLSMNEMKIVQMLSEHPIMKLDDISKALNIQKIMPIINSMIEQKIIVMDEELRQKFTPRSEAFITIDPQYEGDASKEVFDELEKKKTTQKQVATLLQFMQLSNFGKEAVLQKTLTNQSGVSESALKTLIKNGILHKEYQVVSRLQQYDQLTSPDSITLNEEQQKAFEYLKNTEQPAVSLLHGVTSSGKTEVYIKLIDEVVKQGKQVLFLLPEIALTTQIINRLRKYFGDKVGVYHSKFSTSQRAEVWNRTMESDKEKRYQILLGARSAIFLPFQDLGLVIVDEEHDNSYKQYDPAPRYQGRDTAIYLAHIWNAKTILGSATPSLESYYNAKQGRYGFCTMEHRYGGVMMPEILCVDLKEAQKQAEVNGHLSKFLIDHIKEALQNHEQVILFQNRRGFSLRIECDDCHWTPECKNCDVSLVYHKIYNSLRCHYCGYNETIPSECPQCHSTHLSMKGFGTERIEDDLQIIFPKAQIARLDLDAASQKNRYLEILQDFESRKIDILVGTQMVTKGLDFENVSVVGILSADNLINYPDFRSFERSFQQMTQVSGRAGRHGKQGKVIIQTYNPWHQAIRNVIDNDYTEMYNSQIQERRVFRYPPLYRLIEISIRHRDSEILNDASARLATMLRSDFGNRVLGPEYPSISRIRNQYIKKIIIRFERREPIAQAKKIIIEMSDEILKLKQYAPISIGFDVDPA